MTTIIIIGSERNMTLVIWQDKRVIRNNFKWGLCTHCQLPGLSKFMILRSIVGEIMTDAVMNMNEMMTIQRWCMTIGQEWSAVGRRLLYNNGAWLWLLKAIERLGMNTCWRSSWIVLIMLIKTINRLDFIVNFNKVISGCIHTFTSTWIHVIRKIAVKLVNWDSGKEIIMVG